MKTDPISNIEWVHRNELHANHWNPNRVATPELKLLETSILETGWVQPVLVSESGMVIDGFHRWSLVSDPSTVVSKRYEGRLPVARLPVSDADAMVVTVRMNRAKGAHVAILMHELVSELIDVHSMSRKQIAKGIGATLKEVDLLYQKSVFKAKKLETYRYSQAWVPRDKRIHGAPSERDKRVGERHGQLPDDT